MYNELIEALDLAGKDDSVITVVTGDVSFKMPPHYYIQSIYLFSDPCFAVCKGSGDYYCSGNDLNNFTNTPAGGVEALAKSSGELLRYTVFLSDMNQFMSC